MTKHNRMLVIDFFNPLWTENFHCFSGVTGTLTACHTAMLMGIYTNYILWKRIYLERFKNVYISVTNRDNFFRQLLK